MRVMKSLALLATLAAVSFAAPYQVVVDTTSLAGGDFQVYMALTSNLPGNTVTASGFTFGGGAAIQPPLFGTGNLTSTVTLQTPQPGNFLFDQFAQNFTAGSSLIFLLDFSNTPPASGNPPDTFAFAISDTGGANLATTDPKGDNNLLVVDLTGGPLSFNTYTTLVGDVTVRVSQVNDVPEPAFGAAVGGLLALVAGVRRFRKSA